MVECVVMALITIILMLIALMKQIWGKAYIYCVLLIFFWLCIPVLHAHVIKPDETNRFFKDPLDEESVFFFRVSF